MPDLTTTASTLPASDPSSEQTLYISLDARHRPQPSPACETCPVSIWFTSGDQLKCFCSRMHLIVWDHTVPPIMTCDGRELALLALQTEGGGGVTPTLRGRRSRSSLVSDFQREQPMPDQRPHVQRPSGKGLDRG